MTLKEMLKRIFLGGDGEPLFAHSLSQAACSEAGIAAGAGVPPPTHTKRENIPEYVAKRSAKNGDTSIAGEVTHVAPQAKQAVVH